MGAPRDVPPPSPFFPLCEGCFSTSTGPDSAHINAGFLTKLVEADVLSVLTEALTAHVQLVLADQSLLVRADHTAPGTLAHADLLARTPLVEMPHSD